jgi:phosphoribosylformylglycinamidine cyclo-ligase
MADSEEYTSRGVSPTKDDVHAAIRNVDAGLFPFAFCKVVADVGGSADNVVIMHADGAGTKSTLAYLHYKETGDASVFRGIAQDASVMNIDDVACVGATGNFLLSNTIGRNAHRCGAEVIAALVDGYSTYAATMQGLGIDVVLTGGETADVGDLVMTVIVDSTLYVRFPRSEVVDCGNIAPGHVIVGVSSTGRATYESADNSGMGSNGLTLARHVLLSKQYAERYPETYSSTIAADKVYGGPFAMTDPLPGSNMTVGQALLSPTRTYVPIVRDALRAHRSAISGIVHCTGGGQAKCKSFGRGVHFVKSDLFDVPPLFRAIQEAAGIEWSQMFEAFNMGHRMEFVCAPAAASAIIAISESYGIAAKVVGEVRPGAKSAAKSAVTIQHAGKSYQYGG